MFSGKRGPVLSLGEKMGMSSTSWTLRPGADGVWFVLADALHNGRFDNRRLALTPMTGPYRHCGDTGSKLGTGTQSRCPANKHSNRGGRRLEEPSNA